MRKLLTSILLCLGLCTVASAQLRTSSDAANGNFVIGLDNYLRFTAFGSGSAGFDFSTKGKSFKALVSGQRIEIAEKDGPKTVVYDNGSFQLTPARPALSIPQVGVSATGRPLDSNGIVIGIHDFTNDRQPELVVAIRDISGEGAHGNGLVIYVLDFKDGNWHSCGEIAAFGPEIEECRISRQVMTISEGDNYYNWTYRGSGFDFRGNGRSTDPSTAFSAAR